MPQSSIRDTLSGLSLEQLKCPVVIEVFSGSARVTAALRAVGLKSSFGVDHDVSKAIAAVKQLDLTTNYGQQMLLTWLKSPMLVGLFIAPPCGTCSLARCIQLRDSRGKPLSGPRPLRSSVFPDGLQGLSANERRRVSQANKLYDFVQQLITEADALGLVVVVENPRNSLYWQTKFWQGLKVPMTYTLHQACAYGGSRPKFTTLAHNRAEFAVINKLCPGESPFHLHKPWGIVHTSAGTHFSTSEETAYPVGLAAAIARAFVQVLLNRGWVPPPESLTVNLEAMNLQEIRALVGSQPKASKIAPLVREHKCVFIVQGPLEALTTTPVFPMQRLKSDWPIPNGCHAAVAVIPSEAQLLRFTPLRSKGGILQSDLDKHGQAWGIPFSPQEFVSEAAKSGHPKSFGSIVPGILRDAIALNFDGNGAELVKMRAEYFKHWMKRATELQADELDVKAGMPIHLKDILAPKRLLVWKEMLESVNYPDIEVVTEMIECTQLTGIIPPTGIFDKAFKPAESTVNMLMESSTSKRLAAYYGTRTSGDPAVDEAVYSKTMEEVQAGWASGPIPLDDLPTQAVISRRFGLKQGEKVRLIDDLSGSGINQTVQASESPKPHTTDVVASALLEMLKFCSGASLLGRAFDMKSAYKQMGIHEDSLKVAFVSVFNPKLRRPEIFQLRAVPFGATRSVYAFLRVAHSIWFLGVKALGIMWTCFFDDYLTFSNEGLCNNTAHTVDLFFRLLGWKYAVDGDKAQSFSASFTALGIQIDLSGFSKGFINFSNTQKRVEELSAAMSLMLNKGTMTVLESQKLRGRMQFADSQLFGRAGKLCLKAISDHAFVHGAGKMSAECCNALRRFTAFLQESIPRKIQRATGSTWYIFTDACYEPTAPVWKGGLGGFLLDELGGQQQYFSHCLSDSELQRLGVPKKKTVIFEAELLAVLLAIKIWSSVLAAQQVVCYIDNNSARDVSISGVARNECATVLLENLISEEMNCSAYMWYARVPSPSNLSDGPSRGDLSIVEDTCAQADVSSVLTSILGKLPMS